MGQRRGPDIVHRWEGNPVLSPEDVPFRLADICNAGVAKVNNEYVLLVTIQGLKGYYWIYAARSRDGYHFEIEETPLMGPSGEWPDPTVDEEGVMDARVTPFGDYYYVVYNAVGRNGYRLALAQTSDFRSLQRLGAISEPDTKGGALFPEKINGKFVRLERPWEGGSIWLSYSEDLVYWGESVFVMGPRGGYWDGNRVGAATPPMKIAQGWLFLYYGIKETSAGPLFRLGAAILDPEQPWKVAGRTNVPVLSPRTLLERLGDVPNLVFSCGALIEPNNEVKLYYGAANSCICLGVTSVDDIVQTCSESRKEF
ncbi:MAG TPA: glycoside hydrolase family 130 protein [Candidatus Hydrogenedentes bacterium]|nr:glycoside hydrolase family 130 protein [Candidatus Hydrogenedentota bacterium]